MNPAWIAAAASVAAVVISVKPLRWLFRLLIGTHEFIADWPRMKADVTDLKNEVADIKAETKPDGGHSLRDVVHRTARDVVDIKDEQARLRALVELRNPPPRTRKPPA